MNAGRAVGFFALLFIAPTMFSCATSSRPRLFHQGMTYWEVEKIYTEKGQYPILPSPFTMSNRFGQKIWIYEFDLYESKRDQAANKKTRYRTYFIGRTQDDFRLLQWAEKGYWEETEAILKKTRFK
jgi:hypothetical protein